MMDVDHFKRFNDQHGHQAGDDALVDVGRVLSRVARAEDRACRMGGEEFALLLPGADERAAAEVAERVRRDVEDTAPRPRARSPSASGVAAWDAGRHGDGAGLRAAADARLYAAKGAGRNRVVGAPADDRRLAGAGRKRLAQDRDAPSSGSVRPAHVGEVAVVDDQVVADGGQQGAASAGPPGPAAAGRDRRSGGGSRPARARRGSRCRRPRPPTRREWSSSSMRASRASAARSSPTQRFGASRCAQPATVTPMTCPPAPAAPSETAAIAPS